MDSTSLEILAQWAEGDLIQKGSVLQTSNLNTDTRKIQAGDLFVALRGENFDGHKFLQEAASRGAIGAIVDEVEGEVPADFSLIKVADTLHALQKVAARYRQQLSMKVVAITGSNGKTSTKDFTAAVLAQKFKTLKTEGNLNNHIGLPLSILRAESSDEAGVFEIGMNHPGEVAPLAAIAAPDVAIITNVGTAHIEFMGSREAIALEKGRLGEALDEDGVLVLNAEDEYSSRIAKRSPGKAVFAGLNSGEIRAEDVHQDEKGSAFVLAEGSKKINATLSVPGLHMVSNALLAVATGRVLGLSLEECAMGLARVQLTKGRLEQKVVNGIRIIDDSYNANPDSMVAALKTLAAIPVEGRRIAVLGRMGELGKESEQGHRSVGEAAAKEGIHCVVSVGSEASLITESARSHGMQETFQVESTGEAAGLLKKLAHHGDVVLIKGSRSARMEKIVEDFAAL